MGPHGDKSQSLRQYVLTSQYPTVGQFLVVVKAFKPYIGLCRIVLYSVAIGAIGLFVTDFYTVSRHARRLKPLIMQAP